MSECFDWRDAPRGDFAVIGDPVSHSLSPRMHSAAFRALDLDYTYRAIRVPAGEVAAALGRLSEIGYRGVNVTVPHKEEAFEAMASVSDLAARCRAVNTIALGGYCGTNTDGDGFMETLIGRVGTASSVLLLGAGGSARAIALALALGGYNLRVFNRTPERALALVRDLGIEAQVVDSPDLTDADLIVNATAASLASESLPLDWRAAKAGALAYDLVYGETPFLAAAADAGLRTLDGRELLVAQGARSLDYWLGVEAPRGVMLEAIR